MTVPVQNPYNSYNANGSTTQFRYEFLIKDASDLSVTLDGAVVDKSKYTLTNIRQSNGGDVKFTTAPVAGLLIIRRAVIAQRLTDYQDNGPLRAEDVNRDFDRVVMMIQDKQADADTALKHPLGQNGTSAPYTYDANGGRIIDLGTPTADTDAATKKYVDDLYVDKAAQAVLQAEAARDAAVVSANEAAASQQSASSSQSAASGSQMAAKTSETNAANSASAAAASASAAAGSASTATQAAGTASGAATTATQASSGATQQANQASASATAAGQSATAAAGSATTAGQQAGAAAGSATAAFNAQKAAEKARDEAINVAPGNYMLKTNNLSDLTNKATARTNLQLGDSSTKNTGITANTVAAGDDARITGAMQKSQNGRDIPDVAKFLQNLRLSDSAGFVGRLIGPPKIFTSSGTYTPTPGTKKILIEVQGAGSGGGGAGATSATSYSAGGNGTGGGYAMSLLDVAADKITSVPVTVGAGGLGGDGYPTGGNVGGASKFGSFITAGGGKGSLTTVPRDTAFTITGASGGIATGGNIINRQGDGSDSVICIGGLIVIGRAGSSKFGAGGSGYAIWNIPGVNGVGYGSGGTGAASNNSPDAFYSGGNGADGIVIVWELA